MQEKFSFVFIFIIFSLLTFSGNENKKTITFVEFFSSEKNIVAVKHLVDIAIIKINENNKNIIIKENNEVFDAENKIKIENFLIANNLNAFYHINVFEKENKTNLDVKVFSLDKSLIFNEVLIFDQKDISDSELLFSEAFIGKWLTLIESSIKEINAVKEKLFINKIIKNKTDFSRDFPIFNFSINAISAKIYPDEKLYIYPYKIFSFFPFDFRISFYPLKYFEAGLFLNLGYDNLVVRYYDVKDKEYKFFDIGFTMQYGFFLGASFFNEDKFHYSLGLQVSNMFYNTTKEPEWIKTNDYKSWFLPQFAFYQKADFKLFKFLYFTLLLSIKTSPLFFIEDDYFFSKPFNFDLFYVEMSIIGLSIVF